MGPDQLAGVMDIVKSGSAARKNPGKVQEEPKKKSGPNKTRDMVERESQAYYTSANLLDDGIIDPRDTRDVLGMCLDVVHIPEVQGADNHRGLARL